eukprot:RCo031435
MATAAARTVLITGANRGLGAEFVRQYAAEGWSVLACCRDPTALAEVGDLSRYPGKVDFRKLDLHDDASIIKLRDDLKGTSIDVLLNNAGVFPHGSLGSMDYKAWADAFAINTMAPFRMTEVFLENVLLSATKTVVLISSLMGSIDDNRSGGSYEYRSSKAALNMVAKSLSVDLKPKGVKVVLLHPGWVPTRMGGSGGRDNIVESIKGMRSLIGSATMETSGRFFYYTGSEIKW